MNISRHIGHPPCSGGSLLGFGGIPTEIRTQTLLQAVKPLLQSFFQAEHKGPGRRPFAESTISPEPGKTRRSGERSLIAGFSKAARAQQATAVIGARSDSTVLSHRQYCEPETCSVRISVVSVEICRHMMTLRDYQIWWLKATEKFDTLSAVLGRKIRRPVTPNRMMTNRAAIIRFCSPKRPPDPHIQKQVCEGCMSTNLARRKRMVTAILFCMWLFCAFLSYGLMLGYATAQWPDQEHAIEVAVFSAGFGPFALIASLSLATPHHWTLRPLSREERREAFKKKYPHLAL